MPYSTHPVLNEIRTEITRITINLFFYKESFLLKIDKNVYSSKVP